MEKTMKEKIVQIKPYRELSKKEYSTIYDMYKIHVILSDEDNKNLFFHVSNEDNRFYIQLTINPKIKLINGFVDQILGFRSDNLRYVADYDIMMKIIEPEDEVYILYTQMFEDTLYKNSDLIAIIPNLKTYFVLFHNGVDHINFDDVYMVSMSWYVIDVVNDSTQYVDKQPNLEKSEKLIELPVFQIFNSSLLRYPYDEYLCLVFLDSDNHIFIPNRKFTMMHMITKKKEFDIFGNESLVKYINYRHNGIILQDKCAIPLFDIHDVPGRTQALEVVNEIMENPYSMDYIKSLLDMAIRGSNEYGITTIKYPIKPHFIKIWKTLNPARLFIPADE